MWMSARYSLHSCSLIGNNSDVCAIGGTSRVTFGILAKRLNITIYPILCHGWFLELLQLKQF